MNMNEFDAQIDEMNQMVHELIEKMRKQDAEMNDLVNTLLERIRKQEHDLRIMYNRCYAVDRVISQGSCCTMCLQKENCDRLRGVNND